MPNRVSAILPAAAIAALSVAAFLTACQPAPVANAAGENASDQGPLPPPLPLGVPILALMLGPIGDASDDVFLTAMSPTGLSDDDWMRVGSAAVDLVANASAITLSGPGPKDMEWVRDPAWQQRARDMRTASMAVGAATSRRDSVALTESSAQLAASCQACHLAFSPHLVSAPPQTVGAQADR